MFTALAIRGNNAGQRPSAKRKMARHEGIFRKIGSKIKNYAIDKHVYQNLENA